MGLVMVVQFYSGLFTGHLEFTLSAFETSMPGPEKVLSNIC